MVIPRLPRRFEKSRRPEQEHDDDRHVGGKRSELRPHENAKRLG